MLDVISHVGEDGKVAMLDAFGRDIRKKSREREREVGFDFICISCCLLGKPSLDLPEIFGIHLFLSRVACFASGIPTCFYGLKNYKSQKKTSIPSQIVLRNKKIKSNPSC